MVNNDVIKFGIGIVVAGGLLFFSVASNLISIIPKANPQSLVYVSVFTFLIGLGTIAYGALSKGKNG